MIGRTPFRAARGLVSGAAGLIVLTTCSAARPSPVTPDLCALTFVVETPPSTPAGATIWIAGNLIELGAWNGAGVALLPAGRRQYAATVRVPRGASLEFKVTRGSWETVEKDASGGELPNRTWQADRDDTVRFAVAAWRDQTESHARASTLSGIVRAHPAFPSRHVRPRNVQVYLPPGYDADTLARYPVVYFHDGNNVFDAATSFLGIEWGADETAERLIRARAVRPFIAVSVWNTPDRMAEYSPTVDSRHGGGRAAAYGRFLIEELKPFVDRAYRTRTGPNETGIIGSSLGGLVSLYLALERPEVFGLVGCVSPATFWAGRDIVRRAQRAPPGLRVWLDIGDAEDTPTAGKRVWLEDTRALRDALVENGYCLGEDLHYEEVPGGRHNEAAWAARLDRILVFLLSSPDAQKP